MTDKKKYFDEKLQEIRNPMSTHKIRYRKRRQEELEAQKYLEEELEELKRNDD